MLTFERTEYCGQPVIDARCGLIRFGLVTTPVELRLTPSQLVVRAPELEDEVLAFVSWEELLQLAAEQGVSLVRPAAEPAVPLDEPSFTSVVDGVGISNRVPAAYLVHTVESLPPGSEGFLHMSALAVAPDRRLFLERDAPVLPVGHASEDVTVRRGDAGLAVHFAAGFDQPLFVENGVADDPRYVLAGAIIFPGTEIDPFRVAR